VSTVGEYAAITLLKYDANAKSRLVDLSMLEEQPIQETAPVIEEPDTSQQQKDKEQEQTVIDKTGGQNSIPVAESMEKFLNLPAGVSLAYSGYEVAQSYREEGDLYFALEASAGKQLLILSFDLMNQSGTDQNIRLIDQHNSYRISVNSDYTRTALTTMLDNDMTTFMGDIKAGAERKLVLLIEIDPVQIPQVDSLSLQFKNSEMTYALQVL